MYARPIIDARIELAEKELGFKLEYHTPSEIDDFNARLEENHFPAYAAARKASQGSKEPESPFQFTMMKELCSPGDQLLTSDEIRFIKNERALSMCDARYWMERYFCNPPEAPVWMGDLSFKPIGEVQIGDEVIGWDKQNTGSRWLKQTKRTRMQDMLTKATVLEIHKRKSPIVKVTMESGRTIRCSPDHLWSNGAANSTNGKGKSRDREPWIKAAVGRYLGRVIDPVSAIPYGLDRIAGWLGGIYDGEGSTSTISQSSDHNPDVLAEISSAMTKLSIPHTVPPPTKTGNVPIIMTGGRQTYLKFLLHAQPVRRKQLEKVILGGKFRNPDRVVSIDPDGIGEVISLRTTTGNYVVWGYASKNCIKTPDKGVIRFSFLPAQEIYLNAIAEMEAERSPIEIIMAKARQHGVSTATAGLLLHKTAYRYGVNSVAASADDNMTEKMSQMYFLAYDLIPWWNRPNYTRRVESKSGMFGFGSVRSSINFQHGSQTSGLARGDTLMGYHLSEVSSYTDPIHQIEAALFKAVHPHPDVLGILESTADGNTGWFHDTYWLSKREWENRRSRLCSLFLPWFLGMDKYPTSTWLRLHPIPHNWTPMDETMAMTTRAEVFISTNVLLRKVLGVNWKLPREQAWWWEFQYFEHRAKGLEKLLFQEYPTDDQEAFQSSYDNVFGREVIAEIDTKRESRYDVFGIIGQSIEDRYEPEESEYDEDISPISVKFVNRIKDLAYRWELQPLLWKEPFNAIEDIRSTDDAHMGKLFVYREPELGYDYSMGVRTGDGIGSGDTVIAVARRGRDPQEPDIQVAEFRSNEVSHVEAYAWTMAIAAYYARLMGRSGVRKEQPYVAIEQMQAVGDTCYMQMQKMGYRRFHKMTRYDTEPRNMKKSNSSRVGWFSTGWSTPMYTGTFVVWVRNGWYQVNSPYTIWEMDHWQQHSTSTGKAKYAASEESTDGGVLANAMAAFCVNDMRSMAERTMKRCYDGTGSKVKLDLTPTEKGTAFPISARYNSLDERNLFGKSRY